MKKTLLVGLLILSACAGPNTSLDEGDSSNDSVISQMSVGEGATATAGSESDIEVEADEKANNRGILYHGTSSFYLKDIGVSGLTGIYPEDLYRKIEKFWPFLRRCEKQHRAYVYVPFFLERQRNVRAAGPIELSFTHDMRVANEFAGHGRTLGEGPGYFGHLLGQCLRSEQHAIPEADLDEAYELSETLNQARGFPGIVLAVKEAEFPLEELSSFRGDKYETPVKRALPVEKLYIVRDQDLIKLDSPAGQQYVDSIIKSKLEVPPLPRPLKASTDEVDAVNLPTQILNLSPEQVEKFRIGTDERSQLAKYAQYTFKHERPENGRYNLFPKKIAELLTGDLPPAIWGLSNEEITKYQIGFSGRSLLPQFADYTFTYQYDARTKIYDLFPTRQ